MNDRFKFRIWDNEFKKYRTGLGINNGLVCTYNDDTCVLEQSTGLKDKNGKLIYEGDIVVIDGNYKYDKYKVQFSEDSCEYDLFDNEDNFIYQLTHSMTKYLEVIGDIHENPELLEVQDE